MRDYQESVTTGQTDRWTDRQTPDKVIPMCRYASQVTQKMKLHSMFQRTESKDVKQKTQLSTMSTSVKSKIS